MRRIVMGEVLKIDTRETAVMVRHALKAAWPEMKFSVRMARGTAYGWLDVSWSDGPTCRQVDDLVGLYQGSRFDGMDDAYHRLPNRLVCFAGTELPTEVRFACCGILTTRQIGPAGYAHVAALINAAQAGAARLTEDGCRLLDSPMLTDDTAAVLGVLPGPVDVACAAWRLHSRHDLTTTR
jgi:Large polyvalent protein associated domain 29